MMYVRDHDGGVNSRIIQDHVVFIRFVIFHVMMMVSLIKKKQQMEEGYYIRFWNEGKAASEQIWKRIRSLLAMELNTAKEKNSAAIIHVDFTTTRVTKVPTVMLGYYYCL
uniref:Uncharacterized protein n=1 Tax=Tanacetum cinerariifolium TaxID=118510 RepID=A0A699IZA4_TANCI|nr:hypothetical protein [Tanacetum cinerariifolium]